MARKQISKTLTLDMTVVSTLADSYLHALSHFAGGAAVNAADKMESQYSLLPSDYTSQLIPVESIGLLHSSAVDL